ncbi:MAG: quinol:cytochrome C oxidoreductase [Bacteroidetes bacterium]|nr:MAG: quinol:cytochrome C oxidoreductase [Bacteroidota bacterium]
MMENRYTVSPKLKYTSFALMAIGVIALGIGFSTGADRAWANVLLNSYYFLSLAVGASFFLALQYITQSGWSAMFKRIPEAMGTYIPVGAGILLLFLIFGSHSVYHWTHADAVANDELLQHKASYLNLSFMIIRYVLFVGSWVLLAGMLRKYSLREDEVGGTKYFKKSEFLSKIFIFVLAFTFTLATIDWIMSVNPHWFSTLFSAKNFMTAFFHGAAIITLIAILLNRNGNLPGLNKYHLHDFSKYIFMLSIIYGYLWYSQYFLIWYANIPEETVYYTTLIHGGWKSLFIADIAINWAFPFLFLMLNVIAKNAKALMFTAIILSIGQWIDLYLQIMPGSTGVNVIGFVEIGSYLGFLGLFIFVVSRSLSKASLVPKNHPYLQESTAHKLH